MAQSNVFSNYILLGNKLITWKKTCDEMREIYRSSNAKHYDTDNATYASLWVYTKHIYQLLYYDGNILREKAIKVPYTENQNTSSHHDELNQYKNLLLIVKKIFNITAKVYDNLCNMRYMMDKFTVITKLKQINDPLYREYVIFVDLVETDVLHKIFCMRSGQPLKLVNALDANRKRLMLMFLFIQRIINSH